MGSNNAKQAIIKTILYKDIFNFPLSKDELWEFLISGKKINKLDFENALHDLPKEIVYRDGFYCASEKIGIIKRRKRNLIEARKKMDIAKKTADLLSYIPTILFIGLSGGVAAQNVKEDDDIDLFIITKKNTLFITRFWILTLLESAGLRRKRKSYGSEAANKVCVNLLIDESALAWSPRKRDLYTANEIAQMKPLFERKEMYKKFLEQNKWVSKYLPNALLYSPYFQSPKSENNYYTLHFFEFIIRISPIAWFIESVQKLLIKKHQTKEVIKNNILAFHPHDYRRETLEMMREKLHQSVVLTNL